MLEVVLAASLVPGAAPVLPLVLGPALDRGGHGDTQGLQGVVHHLLATPVHRGSRGQILDNYPPTVCSHHMPTDAWFLATIARLLAIIIRLLALMARLSEACEM